jgi:hypothetical protein
MTRRYPSRRLDPALAPSRLYVDPCPRCEIAYKAALDAGHLRRIVCPVCGRHAIRPS